MFISATGPRTQTVWCRLPGLGCVRAAHVDMDVDASDRGLGLDVGFGVTEPTAADVAVAVVVVASSHFRRHSGHVGVRLSHWSMQQL